MNLNLFRDGITIFLGIVVEAIPFLLLGVIASSFVHVYVKSQTMLRIVPKSRWGSVLVGPIMGFVFPVCECGNIPLARRMLRKGLPPHTVIAFLLAAPVFNPIVILATYAAFTNQPHIVVLRIVLSLLVALIVSGLVALIKNPKELINPKVMKEKDSCDCHSKPGQKMPRHRQFLDNMINEFIELGALLALGGMIASFSQILIPRQTLTNLGKGPISSVLTMMALAAVISVCSNVDAFFALSYANNFSTGAILAFLVFGPMIDIKVLIMLPKIFKIKTIVYLTLIIAQLVFLMTLFYNFTVL